MVDQEFDPTAKSGGGEQIRQLDPGSIEPNPHQPRQHFDQPALEQLASSIKLHGILQPLVLTKVGEGKYQLIAGERRLRAAKIAGLSTVPAVVRSFDEQEKIELALIENLQRENLNPIETATAYRKLVDQFNLTLEELSDRVGKERPTISNTMRLLGLPIDAKRAVAEGKISEGHGRTILSLEDSAKQQQLLELIIKNGWTVRQAEEFARGLRPKTGDTEKAFQRIAKTNDLTNSLSDYLGTKVTQQSTAKGGKLIIEYYSEEELGRIYQAIKKDQS